MLRKTLLWSLVCTLVVAAWVGVGVHWITRLTGYRNLESLGQLGDSTAILGTWFSGLAFVVLIATLVLQRQELKLQREELSATRHELKGSREAQSEQARLLRDAARLTALATLTRVYTDMSLHKDHSYPRPPDMEQAARARDAMLKDLEKELENLRYMQG